MKELLSLNSFLKLVLSLIYIVCFYSFFTQIAHAQIAQHYCKDSFTVGRATYACSVDAYCSKTLNDLSNIDTFLQNDSRKEISAKCGQACIDTCKDQEGKEKRQCAKNCRSSCIIKTMATPIMNVIKVYYNQCKSSENISKCAKSEAKPFCDAKSLRWTAELYYPPQNGDDFQALRSYYEKVKRKYLNRCATIDKEVNAATELAKQSINGILQCDVADANYSICRSGLEQRHPLEKLNVFANAAAENYKDLALIKCATPTPTPTPVVEWLGCQKAKSCDTKRDDISYTDVDGVTSCFCDQVCCSDFGDCCSNFAMYCANSGADDTKSCLSSSISSFSSVRSRSRRP